MNRSVLESSSVQQFGNPNWWNVSGGLRTQPPLMGHQQTPHTTPNNNYPPTLFPHFLPSPATSSSSSSSPSLHKNPNISSLLESNDLPPESWSLSQLLLGGLMMGEEERLEMMNHQQPSMVAVDIKQESNNNGCYVLSSPNSPPNKSCVTTSLNSNEDNNNNLYLSEGRHTPPDRSSECNSLEIGGSSNKKPRLQPSHSSQSTLKVRKEKLGGRIAALHQLVSPFGKTDTASVLSEAIGYIRFLHSQIEALSHPYFGTTTSGIMMHQQQLQGDGSCVFTEESDQLVNDQRMKRREASCMDNQNANEEPKKDLRSRGLTLVPISCILQVDTDNGADYWAPALSSAGFL